MESEPVTRRSGLFGSWLGFVLAAAMAVVAPLVPAEDRDRDPAAVLRGGGGDRAVRTGRMVRPARAVAAMGGAVDAAALLRRARPAGRIGHSAAYPADRDPGQSAAPFRRAHRRQLASLFERYPELHAYFQRRLGAASLAPPAAEVFRGLGGVSLGLLGAVALALIFSAPSPISSSTRGRCSRLSRQPAAPRACARGARLSPWPPIR